VNQPIAKYNEAFICYGRHSNTKLLIEYGFTIGKANRSEVIAIEVDDLLNFLHCSHPPIQALDKRLQLLREAKLTTNLGFSETGLSWNIKAVFHILLLDTSSLSDWHSVYNHEEFADLQIVFQEFLAHFHKNMIKALAKMNNIVAPSKFFYLSIDLVASHVELLNELMK